MRVRTGISTPMILGKGMGTLRALGLGIEQVKGMGALRGTTFRSETR
jgi:hypothetical protein